MLFDWSWNIKVNQSHDNLPMHSLDFNPIEFYGSMKLTQTVVDTSGVVRRKIFRFIQ